MEDPERRPRERWLRVVREDEVAKPPAPPPGRPPPGPPTRPRQPRRGPGRARAAVRDGTPDSGPRVGRRARALRVVLGTVGAGTLGALGIDVLLGPVDGKPPLHLLVVLALPFWDGLPARLGPRLLVLVAVLGAIAAAWLALAGLWPEPWWRAEACFGLACALVGAVQVVLPARGRPGRTVER